MPNQSFRQRKPIELAVIYTIMTLAVVSIATLILFFVMGFRFNVDDGRIEQYAFLQFGSSPSGATVTIDGKVVGSKTPSESSIRPGKHEVVMWRDGYQTWSKAVNSKAGTITWLNYALMVPNKLNVESVAQYSSLSQTLASPRSHYMLVQQSGDTPSFDLADISSNVVSSTKLTIPSKIYSQAGEANVQHAFRLVRWDSSERYVLVEHTFGSDKEWLVLDTQDASLTKNVTQSFSIPINDIVFLGTNGNTFFVLSGTDILKIDLSSRTISKSLVSNIKSFSIYDSRIVTYIGVDSTGKQFAGVYRDGDSNLHILRTAISTDSALQIATTHYFNQNYIAISESKQIDIYSGSYPNTIADNATSMKIIESFSTSQDVGSLTFSPTGEYVFVQSGSYFASYDLEHQTFASSTVDGTGATPQLKWLNDNYVWSDRGGNLVIREFDGTNSHTIGVVESGQDAALTSDGKYIYNIAKTATGYQLQRVSMILP